MPHSPVFLLTMNIHFALLGRVKRVYVPAGTSRVPILRLPAVMRVVAGLAPVRQTSP